MAMLNNQRVYIYYQLSYSPLYPTKLPMTDPCMLYMVTWIPSIYPSHVSIYIYISAPWIRHGLYQLSQANDIPIYPN